MVIALQSHQLAEEWLMMIDVKDVKVSRMMSRFQGCYLKVVDDVKVSRMSPF